MAIAMALNGGTWSVMLAMGAALGGLITAQLGVVGALGVALLLTLDVPLRHGYTASWYHDGPEHERVLVDTTTEHRVEFPNVHRPLARYVNGWPHDVMPRLTGLPRIDAALRARIEIPDGPALHLGADVDASARIWADGEPVTPAPVTIEAVPGALLLAGVTLSS